MFTARTAPDARRRQASRSGVSEVVDRALCKRRDDRYKTAATFAQALRIALKRFRADFGETASLALVKDLPPEPDLFDPKLPSGLALPSRNPFLSEGVAVDAPRSEGKYGGTVEMAHVDRAALDALRGGQQTPPAPAAGGLAPASPPPPKADDGEDEESRARTRELAKVTRADLAARFGGPVDAAPPAARTTPASPADRAPSPAPATRTRSFALVCGMALLVFGAFATLWAYAH